MTVEQALKELVEAGADIEAVNENLFIVRDNGFHGFARPEDPFEIDGEDLLEMHEMYCGE